LYFTLLWVADNPKAREVADLILQTKGGFNDWLCLFQGEDVDMFGLKEVYFKGMWETASISSEWITVFCKIPEGDPKKEKALERAFESATDLSQLKNCFSRATGDLKERIRRKMIQLAEP
jgi:hypothetical protein